MLGLSRVIGETMVVLMVAGGAALIPESLFDPVRPMPASIVAEMAESPFGSSHYHALFAIGIVLFFFTFLCNLAAFLVSQKYKLKARTNTGTSMNLSITLRDRRTFKEYAGLFMIKTGAWIVVALFLASLGYICYHGAGTLSPSFFLPFRK